MTLEQLRVFVCVAEREHVTSAAQVLGITQSTASSAIAALEERQAIKLFHRVGRRVTLTESGRLFLPEARSVLTRADAARAALEKLRGLNQTSLRLIANPTIANYWLPSVLIAFHARFPSIRVEVSIGDTEKVAIRIQEGEADFGFVTTQIRESDLTCWRIGEDRLQLIKAEPFEEGQLDAAWLRQARWILRESGSSTRSTLDDYLTAIGVDPTILDIALVLPSNESIRIAVEAGIGVAGLSMLEVASSIDAGRLFAAPMTIQGHSFFGLYHRERFRTEAADAFLSFDNGSVD